jgi:hypothetical protein
VLSSILSNGIPIELAYLEHEGSFSMRLSSGFITQNLNESSGYLVQLEPANQVLRIVWPNIFTRSVGSVPLFILIEM